MKRLLLGTMVLVLWGCRAPITHADASRLLERSDRIGSALDEAIEAAGREAEEGKRIQELNRLGRVNDALGQARLLGYMSYVDGDFQTFQRANAELNKLEIVLGLER